jgi:hypothetical protein
VTVTGTFEKTAPMKIDATLMAADLGTIASRAKAIEELGYDGLYTAETQHDPFFPLLLAAEHTERIDLATASGSPAAGSSSGSVPRSRPTSRSGSAPASTGRRPACGS